MLLKNVLSGRKAPSSIVSNTGFETLEGRSLFSAPAIDLPQVALVHGCSAPAQSQTPAVRVARPLLHAASRRTVSRPATIHNSSSPAGFFPIAVWLQPTYLMDQWKAAGVNTLFGYESEGGSVSLAQWNSAAVSKGLYTIRTPGKNAAADRADPYLLAYMLDDEPDLKNVKVNTLQAQYNALKQLNPNIPVVVNYAGGAVLHWQANVTSKTYTGYLKATDWVSSDIYPVTGWGLPDRIDAPGKAVTTLMRASGGKPQFAFIETSNQNLSWVPNDKGVTGGQFSAELWTAINHGAKGITYFPQQIGGFSYDATPADVLAAMKTQNARITALGGPLSSDYDPATQGMSLTGNLQGSWRNFGGKSYFIVTNPTDQTLNAGGHLYGIPRGTPSATVNGESRSIPLSNGVFTDSFAPYETHIYVV